MTLDEIALQLAVEMLRNSGTRPWTDLETREQIATAAREMAVDLFFGEIETMATKILVQAMDGTPKQICFADHAADFSAPTAANDLRVTTDGSFETDVQLDLTGVANAAARQSAKVDLGENRARAYKCKAAFELAATPTAGLVISLYWAPSHSGTAANGNAAAVSGADAAYTGYNSNIAASVKQLDYIGDFICTAQATGTVQVAEVGVLVPSERYGSLVVFNNSGAAFHSDAAEINIVLDPIVDEVQ